MMVKVSVAIMATESPMQDALQFPLSQQDDLEDDLEDEVEDDVFPLFISILSQ